VSLESGTEQSDVESIGSRTHICETELGSDEDEEDMYYSDPEGPYIDEPIADEEWLNRIQPRTRRNLEEKPGLQHSHQVEEEQGIALFAKDP
ncbi:unnamed protein product, partial [Porites lobata]